MRTLGKRVRVYPLRGFESLSLRTKDFKFGGMAERTKALVLKTNVCIPYRGFESHSLRVLGEVTEWPKVLAC